MTIQGPKGAGRMRLKKRMVKFISAFAVAVLCAYTPSTAQAVVILEVTGGDSAAGHAIFDDQAALTSFSLSQPFFNVTITAHLDCPVSCRDGDGGVFLVNAFGNTAGIVNIIDAVDFSALTFAGANTVLFTGLNLLIDDYFLVVANEVGLAFWTGSTPGTAAVTTAPGVTHTLDLFADDTGGATTLHVVVRLSACPHVRPLRA